MVIIKKDIESIPDILWQGRRNSDEVLRSIAEQSATGGDGCVVITEKKDIELKPDI